MNRGLGTTALDPATLSIAKALQMSVMQRTVSDTAVGLPAKAHHAASPAGTNLHTLRRTATERRPTSSKSESYQHRSNRSFSGAQSTMILPEEYAALPPSIRKKYFSSSERLCIAQQAATDRRKKAKSSRTWLTAPSTGDLFQRPATSQGVGADGIPSLPDGASKAAAFFNADCITEAQARWYLTLPDKIRKQYFTRKEQISLAVRCKRALNDASPELAEDALRRCLNVPSNDAASARKRSYSSVSAKDSALDNESFLVVDPPEKQSSETTITETEVQIFNMYSRPHMSEAISVPPPPPPPQPFPTKSRPRRKSLHRHFKLTPIPLPPPVLAPLPIGLLTPTAVDTPQFALSARLSRPFMGPFETMPEPATNAMYYQDPDTRSTLRQHLSPEKFDEAIEFGFAVSSDESVPSSPDPLPLQPPPTSHSVRTDDDNSSLDLPKTPTTPPAEYTSFKQPSIDSGISFSTEPSILPSKTSTTHSQSNSITDREMTIKMTLTRPDLRRSPEDELYSTQRQQNSGVELEKADPLALESLAVCDDATGAHGAFAVHEQGSRKSLKRVWRSFSALKGH